MSKLMFWPVNTIKISAPVNIILLIEETVVTVGLLQLPRGAKTVTFGADIISCLSRQPQSLRPFSRLAALLPLRNLGSAAVGHLLHNI